MKLRAFIAQYTDMPPVYIYIGRTCITTVTANAAGRPLAALSFASFCPLQERVVYKGLQHTDQHFSLLPQHPQRDLAYTTEHALVAGYTHGIHHVRREAKGANLRSLQCEAFVKKTVEIDMHTLPIRHIKKYILRMSIAQTNRMSQHRPHCSGPRKTKAVFKPVQ